MSDKLMICAACNGTGWAGDGPQVCPICHGITGKIQIRHFPELHKTPVQRMVPLEDVREWIISELFGREDNYDGDFMNKFDAKFGKEE